MGCCAAPNCANSSEKNYRMFRFPTNPERRAKWVQNCGREGWAPGPNAQLCCVHFEENQFELKRQDGWKKLKPNAIPTLFPEPSENSKPKRIKGVVRKRKRSPSSDEEEIIVPKKRSGHKKKKESLKKKQKLKIKIAVAKKKRNSVVKKKSPDGSSEDNSPRLRKSPRPRKLVASPISDSSEAESDDAADEVVSEDDNEQQIALLKRENESMKQEIAEFEKHNKSMARVILELEKHNKLMGLKLVEMDKEKIVMGKKISDLERMNEDLKNKLNNSFSEEQLARMDKMRQLGTIERYIPALK